MLRYLYPVWVLQPLQTSGGYCREHREGNLCLSVLNRIEILPHFSEDIFNSVSGPEDGLGLF